MATQEQLEQIITQINDKLEQLTGLDINELTKEQELGSQLSFKDYEPWFIKTIELFKRVKSINLEQVPHNLLQAFNGQLTNAMSHLDQVKTFQPNQNNPASVRDQLGNQVRDQYDSYYQGTLPVLTVGLLLGNDLSIQQAKVAELLDEIKTNQEEAKKESDLTLSELQDTLKTAEEAAAKVGVSKHSKVFQLEHTDQEKKAKTWLTTTFIILGAIAVAAGLLILFMPEAKDTYSIVQYTITKLIILSALFYALSISNRNYKAYMHNSVVNKHRQNALTTFETFSNASGSDVQTKNAVLLEATRTIFSNQQTGYLNADKEQESSNKIIEIIKGAATVKKD
ncbi:hypothetical protein [Ekhidna sp.]